MSQIQLTSAAFSHGAFIPRRYTREAEDISPPLAWTGVPAGARELALICDDPDAPRKDPWVHWVAYKIPAQWSELREGASGRKDAGFLEGRNDFGELGYGGPMPPRGHGVHHYHFRLYALDAAIDAEPGMTKAQLLEAIGGHVLAVGELVGLYERK